MENDVTKKPTSKQRASRIPLDYHKQSDAIRKNRNWMTLVAALVAIGLVAAIAISRELLNAAVSPGPVARVHRASELQCSACHDSFVPIHEDARQTNSSVGGADSTASIEKRCQECHHSSAHHPNQIAEAAGSCSACHHEHRGEEASLTEMDDRSCTRCHSQIEEHAKGKPDNPKNITKFYVDHPKFGSLERDRTRLNFNHQLHLSPGLLKPDERKTAWTLADIAPDAQSRYQRPKADQSKDAGDTTFQLICSDCHVSLADKATGRDAALDASLSNFLNLPRNQSPIATGAYMLPVKFTDHCQGCHPLAIDRNADAVAHAMDIPHGLEVPHAVEAERLRQLLEGRAWEKATDDRAGQKTSESRIRPFPGQSPDRPPREAQVTVENFVRDAETHLRGATCNKCHAAGAPAKPDGMVSVEPVNMPAVWLQKSHFNHRAHQAFDCLECHAKALGSKETSDVLILGLEKCVECHTPQVAERRVEERTAEERRVEGRKASVGGAAAAARSGADFRCGECHRYHRGDLSALGPAPAHAHGANRQAAAPLQEGNRASD